uniref:ADP-ribosyltransferase exoenzyme n=1 Tax=Marseillevirus LCMAC201 TaxID=2506605 RepID=A0A481YXV1_9VIRU|nr:MAG: ADP-ribosyltransferase exoenzyme [Marseillevirus LCMAC201]
MSDKYQKYTVKWINHKLEKGYFPNIYPDKSFLKEHYNIINPYLTEIKLYKGLCYKELNTYFKTGEVIIQGDCPVATLDQIAKKAGKTGLSAIEKIKLVAHRIEELYTKVKPLPYDVIVYRGVKRGTIGQNLFSGAYIKTRSYDLDMHRFCEDPDLQNIQLYKNCKGDPRPYISETLGFVSTSSKISVALRFANKGVEYDTVIALILPAGTKFIMPVDSSGDDFEREYILFPQHNTFVINNVIDTEVKVINKKIPIYVGAYCNELNEYRPKLLTLKTTACTSFCEEFLHFCDPKTGKCLGDKPKTYTTIQNWWKQKNLKGKCNKKTIKKCVDKFEACDPNTGKCISTVDIASSGYWDYSSLITARVLDWISPEDIIAKQKERYNCTEDHINTCAQHN